MTQSLTYHISNQHENELKAPPSTFLLPLNIAFYLCLTSHVLAALYAPIQDCDETFNYWEPLHYVLHGYGLETWEYSPEYSIRSWAYVLQYALPARLIGLLGKSKSFQFYSIRIVLAVFASATETRLYSALSKYLNPRVGVFYLLVVAFTPGFFFSSAALLPSSFAMTTSSLALTAFLKRDEHRTTAQGILWFAVGASLGWPFAGALILPFVLKDVIVAIWSNDIIDMTLQYVDGALRVSMTVIVQAAIDFAFYRKLVFVPWRIVSYNVFSGDEKGPDIFGTEPWHYYIRNLALNFNIWMILAFITAPLLLLQATFVKTRSTKQSHVSTIVLTIPFYLWFTIFTAQPHKEERFMFPAYPFLALNAALSMHILLVWIGNSNPKSIVGQIPARLKLILIIPPILIATNIGLLRILGLVSGYRAPLQVYEALSSMTTNITSSDNICIGKEWYRFPSSFFLPEGSHSKFIKSEFDGLLPGEFPEARNIREMLQGTRSIPTGMNDRNEEDTQKHIDINQCSYLIDSNLPSFTPSVQEPNYLDSKEWEKIFCAPFLDSGSTHIVARTIWIPSVSFIPRRFQRVWGEFCLLRRRSGNLSVQDHELDHELDRMDENEQVIRME